VDGAVVDVIDEDCFERGRCHSLMLFKFRAILLSPETGLSLNGTSADELERLNITGTSEHDWDV
jgi:hypothetical protein